MIKRLDKKSKMLVEVIAFSLLITIISTSYAYFTMASNVNGKQNVVTSGSLELAFVDGPRVTAEDVMPGDIIEKTFTVKNIGTVDTSYDIYFSETVNDFANKDDLVYTVVSSTGCESSVERVAPDVAGTRLVSLCSITAGTSQQYTVKIKFKNTNENQDANQGKEFSTKFTINEFQTAEGLNVVDSYLNEANKFYSLNKNSDLLGTNLASSLSVRGKQSDDKVVVTREGKIEMAVARDGVCFRKYATSDEVEEIDEEFCDVDITRFFSNNGRLHVEGYKIYNEYGKEVRVVGGSGNGPHTDDIVYSEGALGILRKWGGNIYRAFIVEGQKYSGNKNWSEKRDYNIEYVRTVVESAIANDMYVMLNWDPNRDNGAPCKEQALDFFTTIASMYPNDPHIIYETWNEPSSQKFTWDFVKAYHDEVVGEIRKISPDAIVICGTGGVSNSMEDPVAFDNVMYTIHSYPTSVSSRQFDTIRECMDNNFPVFMTEWGSVDPNHIFDGLYVEEPTNAWFHFMEDNKLPHIYFGFFTSSHTNASQTYGIVKTGKWDNILDDNVLELNGKLFKRFFKIHNDIPRATILQANVETTYRSDEYKDKITSIEFVTNKNVPSSAVKQWDVSLNQDGNVIGYLLPTSETDRYKLVIAADKEIYFNKFSNNLFSAMKNLRTIDFANTDQRFIYTAQTMFSGDTSLQSLDLSTWNPHALYDIYGMFNNTKALTSFNIGTWNVKLTTVSMLFNGSSAIEELDLSGLDVTGATSFNVDFANCTNLKRLNISTWTLKTYSKVNNMFGSDTNLEWIDMSSFDFLNSEVDIATMFKSVKSNLTLKVKNQDMKDAILAVYPTFTIEVANN